MHIIFLNGSEFRGNWREFTRALWHPLFVGLILAMTGVIFLTQPYDHILPPGVIARTLIVSSAVVVFLACSVSCLSACAQAEIRVRTFAVFIPANICTSVWGVGISILAGGSKLDASGWAQLLAFNFVFCVVGELILASFLLRRIVLETGLEAHPIAAVSPMDRSAPPPFPARAAYQESKPSPPESVLAPESAPVLAPEFINLLGQHVAVDMVLHLKAEEHYVALTLRNGASFLLRGRLADAIAQLPPEAGLQVHRSHWVAATAVAELMRKRDGWRLHLVNGTEIPVARNRQTEVGGWVNAILPST